MKIRDIEQLGKMLGESDTYMTQITSDFRDKNERILYRKKQDTGKSKYPNVLDNTLASYLEKIPKNVIQKIPDFKIKTNSNKVMDLIFEFVAKKIIIKNGGKGYSFLQKQWIAFRNSTTFGMSAVALPFIFDDGDYSVGFQPIYWGDLFLEPYSTDINSANWVMYRTMMNELDICAILEDEDEDVDDGWDRQALKDVLENGAKTTPDYRGTPLINSLHGVPSSMYELFVYTSKEEIITFHHGSQKILRRVKNASGKARVVGLYYDYDGINPFGRSLVDFAYDQQVVLDYLLQAFLYNIGYNLDPAIKVKGQAMDESNFNLESGNVIFTGDADADIELLALDSTTQQQFNQHYNLIKSTLLAALPSSNDTSISAEVGNPGYSRTQAGVNSQERKEEVEVNYSRKNYEQFFETYLENALNIWVNELREVNDVISIQLDDEFANDIKQINPDLVDEDNNIEVMFDKEKVEVKVFVDFESTRAMAKEEDMKRLEGFSRGMFEVMKSDELTAEAIRESVLPSIFENMMKNANIENSAEIIGQFKESVERISQRKAEEHQAEMANGQPQQTQLPQGSMRQPPQEIL